MPSLSRFISEPLQPLHDSRPPIDVTAGAPLLPPAFAWREQQFTISKILDTWKETSPCTSGSGERYLRKHWYRLATVEGPELTIYFERQARAGSQAKSRWFLYTIHESQ